MPSRKHLKPLPRFSFVTPEHEVKGTGWRKKYSDGARRHAAYWGGPAKHRCRDNRSIEGEQQDINNRVSDRDNGPRTADGERFAISTSRSQGPSRPKNIQALEHAPPYHIETDNLQYLPFVVPGIRATGSPFSSGLATFKFYGTDFVEQFIMYDHEDYPIMFSSCLLLSYAHYMALTGLGAKTVLLKLKGRVIHFLSAKIKSSAGVLSPQCLIAILALGSPILCLVSQDMPKGLSIREYIRVSTEENYLCCQQSADAAESSLDERNIHQQAMRRLFLGSEGQFHDIKSLALLKYVSNCINMYAPSTPLTFRVFLNSTDRSMAMESANHLNTPLADIETLFPATSPCGNFCIPDQWASPLTCQWSGKTSTKYFESQMLLLVGFMHRWLATFIDRDGRILLQTEKLLEEQASLRERIEQFEPPPEGSNTEVEAMYDCCRWASLILLAVQKYRIPVRIAAKRIRLKPRLVRRLRMTDLMNLWGSYKGLLFWVAATCQFSTAGQCFPLLCTTLFAHLIQDMAMSGSCDEISIKPLRKLKQFEGLCCHPLPNARAVSADSGSPTKVD